MPITKEQLYNIASYVESETGHFLSEEELPESEKWPILEAFVKNDYRPTNDKTEKDIELVHASINKIAESHKFRLTRNELAAARKFAISRFIATLVNEKKDDIPEWLNVAKQQQMEALNSDLNAPTCLTETAYLFERSLEQLGSQQIRNNVGLLKVEIERANLYPYRARLDTFETLIVVMRKDEHEDIARENAAWMINRHAQLTREHQQLPSRFRQFLHNYRGPLLFLTPILVIFMLPNILLLGYSYDLSAIRRKFQENPEFREALTNRFDQLKTGNTTSDQYVFFKAMQNMLFPENVEEIESKVSQMRFISEILMFGLTIVIAWLACATAVYGVSYLRNAADPRPKPLPSLFQELAKGEQGLRKTAIDQVNRPKLG